MPETFDVANASIDKRSDVDDKPQLSKFWLGEIAAAKKRDQGWHKRADSVIARYRDERNTDRANGERRANILWSNTETLKSALFQGVANPDVRRRFPKKGEDDRRTARQAALVIERGLSYCADAYDLDSQLEACIEDYLLPGRGTGWIVYDAEVSEGYSSPADDQPGKDPGAAEPEAADTPAAAQGPEITYQSVHIEHVYFKDFLTSAGRKWSDCWWVARGHDYSRDELERYWPKHAEKIPLNVSVSGYDTDAKGGKDEADTFKRARVWEIWDKSKKERVYVAEDYASILESKPDPYRLKDFFPTVEPLYGVKTTSTLTPIPEYTLYQDQAEELDIVQTRLSRLTAALKRRGVYDGSVEGPDNQLGQLADADDNQFFPVRNFAALMEKGGLKNVFQTEDLQPMILVIDKLSMREAALLQKIYDITGISDILRGSSDPDETATAQKIKGQFGSLRLQKRQKRIQTFVRDLYRLKAEIISEHFTREQLSEMTGIDMPLKVEQDQVKQMLAAIQQMQQQAQQPPPQGPGPQPGQGASAAMPPHAAAAPMGPPPPPVDPKTTQKLLEVAKSVTWEEIAAILRSDQRRGHKVDIETDATNAIDSETEKAQRIEFLTAMSAFLEKTLMGVKEIPQLATLAKELASFAVGAFKIGRTMEEAFEDAFEQIEQMAQAALAKGPPKDPEMVKMEAEAKGREQELAFKAKEAEMDRQLEQAKAAQQAKLAEQELAHKTKLAEFEAQNEARLAEMKLNQEAQLAQYQAEQSAQIKERAYGLERERFDREGQAQEREFALKREQFDHSVSLDWEKHDREGVAEQEPGGAASVGAEGIAAPDGGSPDAVGTPPATPAQAPQRPRRLILQQMDQVRAENAQAQAAMQQAAQQLAELQGAIQQMGQLLMQQMDSAAQARAAARQPRRLVRGPDGRASHVETGHGVFGIERDPATGRAVGLMPAAVQ